MSVIPQLYNQGTGLIGSTTEGATIPSTVEDLVVQNTLTVLGTSNLVGNVTCDGNLQSVVITATTIEADNLATENMIVENATVTDTATVEKLITQELGSTLVDTFSLPATNGTDGQVLSVLNGSTNPISTQWTSVAGGVTDFVSYAPSSNKLVNNASGVTTEINSLDMGSATVVPDKAELNINRRDTVGNSERVQSFKFNDGNVDGIEMRSLPTSGQDPILTLSLDSSNNEVSMRSILGANTVKEVKVEPTGARMSSDNGTLINKVETIADRVVLTSLGTTDITSRGIVLSTGSGRYIKMPLNTPGVGLYLKVVALGAGTIADPDTTGWGF
jgi:ribosomal protein S8E